MPEESNRHQETRKFTEYKALQRKRILIFCDFETIGEKQNESLCQNCQKGQPNGRGRCICENGFESGQNSAKPQTLSNHYPSMFALIAVSSTNEIIRERIIHFSNDKEAKTKGGERFVETLLQDEPFYKDYLRQDSTPRPDKDDLKRFFESEKCCICEQKFDWSRDYFPEVYKADLIGRDLYPQKKCFSDFSSPPLGEPVVHHHLHLEKRWISGAHRSCNLHLDRNINNINVYFHNMSKFDLAFILPGLKAKGIKNINCIPYNTQKLRTISFNSFRICDSLAHLPSALSKLMDNLRNSNHSFPILKQAELLKNENGTLDDLKFKVSMRKGVFPYEACESISQMKNTPTLPKKEDFTSHLGGKSHITDSDYKFACQVYDLFECSSLFSYCMLYMYIDVLCLAEVFIAYSEKMGKMFGLYPENFLGLPSFAFPAMLYKSGVELGYLNDRSMYKAGEEMIRGGLSFCSHKLAETTDFEFPGDEVTMSFFTDANSLYSTSMLDKLPVDGYRWLSDEELKSFDITGKSWDLDGPKAYIITADISYPEHLHSKHSDVPLLPERRHVKFKELSPYSQKLLRKLGLVHGSGENFSTTKLVASLGPKLFYTAHFKMLALSLSLGLVIDKIHRVIECRQENFVEPYIRTCINARRDAKSPFEKSLFKMAMNACFGKFLENIYNKIDCKIITSREVLRKSAANSDFKSCTLASPSVAVTFHRQSSVFLDRFPLIGGTILDLSKFHMYKTLYYDILPVLGKSARVHFGDTDSYFITFKSTRPKIEVLKDLSPIMDFSNFPKDHTLYNEDKKNEPGYMKDEAEGKVEFTNLCITLPKCYMLKSRRIDGHDEQNDVLRCKGVPRLAASQQLTFEDFRACVEEEKRISIAFQRLKMKDFKITSEQVNKICLSAADTKRYWLCYQHSTALGDTRVTRPDFDGSCFFCASDKKRETKRRKRKKEYLSNQSSKKQCF